ncbi:MAG: hypothetical protein A2896_00555 [Candidatus Nealsonbacteria bacterium RIFCSPLOWO2_01_FULL_43_32]|uniref:Uncharacterized protein n=1 Tax=Candidatus Nealsonbacteria bacterium RIFCSPLOWO2_01_FULL_43_32 TaxID=1801672 RepID=A0A1G2EFM1_9BACT|nr:MAG: hypothetical protein A2896_00555 [Candidatus Nealsonbacteria bacterium RIFCSPLOWO2_01_FULL_43_32]
MKQVFTILFITGLVGLAVFGILAMSHSAGQSHDGCIAATAQGTDCPKEDGTIFFAAFHLDVFRSFSTAIFNGKTASMLFLLIALFFAVAFGLAAHYHRQQFLKSSFFPSQRELTRWLALHENSPAMS